MRKLNSFDATLLVMGGIIGVGLFFTPQTVAERVREPWAYLFMWVFGGLIAMCAAFTFAELGGTYPRSGGWFVFLREAFGDFPAYLFAWVVLSVISTGAMAAILGFAADMLHAALPELIGPQGSASHTATAVGIIAMLTGVTLVGVKQGALLQNVCMIVKLVVVAGLVAAGLSFVASAPDAQAATVAAVAAPAEQSLLRGMLSALLPIFFTYGGWQLVCYIAPTLSEPARVLPRAIIIGVTAVLAVYLVANLAFTHALGLDGLAADPGFAATLARGALGERGERVLSAGMAISAVGVCAVNVITAPWLYVAMARERLFFGAIGHVHPGRGVPVNALLLQAALVLVYFFAATLQQLVDSVVFVEWIFHGLAALALLRLRRRQPDLARPYRSPFYPLAPVVYGLTAVIVVGGTLWTAEARLTSTGLIIMAIGAALYRPWRRLMATS